MHHGILFDRRLSEGFIKTGGGLTEDLRVIDLTKAKRKALVASGIL